MTLTLKPQEIAFDDPRSSNFFDRTGKPFLSTPGAIDAFGFETIVACLIQLQRLAKEKNGLDYLQVFVDDAIGRRLWLIEDGDGGAITALLPNEY